MAAFLFGPLFKGQNENTSRLAIGFITLSSLSAIFSLYALNGQPQLTDSKTVDSLKAQYYYSQGLLSQSVQAYEHLIALYPDDIGLKTEYDQIILELSRIPREELKIIQTVAELKHRLNDTNSSDAGEWRLLANSQMKLGDYDGAIKSFELALKLEPNNAALEDDYDRAVNFIAAQKQARDMSPEERQAMIENMVSGLSTRLKENGGTKEEWTRLITSRRQLGQNELLAQEIEIMKKQFEDRPELIEQILGDMPNE